MRRNVMRRKGSMQKDPCYDNCTDDQLIELSRGGDTAATDFLMEKYKQGKGVSPAGFRRFG